MRYQGPEYRIATLLTSEPVRELLDSVAAVRSRKSASRANGRRSHVDSTCPSTPRTTPNASGGSPFDETRVWVPQLGGPTPPAPVAGRHVAGIVPTCVGGDLARPPHTVQHIERELMNDPMAILKQDHVEAKEILTELGDQVAAAHAAGAVTAAR